MYGRHGEVGRGFVMMAVVLALCVTGLPQPAVAGDVATQRSVDELRAQLEEWLSPVGDGPGGILGRDDAGAGDALGAAPDLLAASPVESPVVVTSIVLSGATAEVTLDWDDPEGIGAFEVLRDGALVAEVTGASDHVDTVDSGATYDYEIRALDGATSTVGTTSVAVSPPARGCDLTWTGAVDGDFAAEANWAPIGTEHSTPRAPGAGDHVCIDTRQNTPATSTAAGAEVTTISTSLSVDAARPRLLEVAGGDLSVTGGLDGVDVAVSGGTLAPAGSPVFRLLTVTGGTLALDGGARAEIAGFGPGAATIRSVSGEAVLFDVGNVTLDDAALTLDGPVRLGGRAGSQLELQGDSSIVPGPTPGASLAHSFVIAQGGTSAVDVAMSGLMIVNDGQLTVSNHDAFTNKTFPPQIAVDGTLVLTQAISELGDVDFYSETAQIILNGGPANDFSGIEKINNVSIDGPLDLVIRDSVQVRSMSLNNGATVAVDGELDFVSYLALSDATITAPSFVTTGTRASDGDIDVFGTENRLVGDVTTNGTIRLNSDAEVGADARLAIDGSLTLGPDSRIESTVTGGDVTGRLAVRDEVALAGAGLVRINGVIPADTDIAAVSWGSSTGDIALDIAGNTTDTTIERTSGGIFVRRDGGGPDPDITSVVALGMVLDPEAGGQLSLAWPKVLDADGYVVRRDGEVIDETADTTALVDVDPGIDVEFSVTAVVGEDLVGLGTLALAIPTGACTITWTGAVSSAWEEPLNWLPVARGPAAMPDPRAPGATDDVCIDVTTNAPVSVTSDASVESVDSAIDAGTVDALVSIAGADVAVGAGVDLPELEIDLGSLTTGATLVLDQVVVGDAVIDAPDSKIRSLRVERAGEGSVAVDLFGVSTITEVVQAAGTVLWMEQLASPGDTALDLAGTTTIEQPVAALRSLSLVSDASLSIGSGATNVLTGLTQIGALDLNVAEVALPETVGIDRLVLERGVVRASGGVTLTGDVDIAESILAVDGDLTLTPSTVIDVRVDAAVDSVELDVAGTANLAGALAVTVGEPVGSMPLASWKNTTGSFATSTFGGAGADGHELVVDETGIRVEPVVPPPPALIATVIDLGDGLGDATISLAWPEFPGAASYQVRRGDVVVNAVPGTTVDVTSTGKQTETWSIVALDGDVFDIGLVGELDVLADVDGCSVAWTGAVDDSWADPYNWVPVVNGGAVSANAVPTAIDLACVQVDTNLPIRVDAPTEVGVIASSVVSRDGVGLDAATEVIDVIGAELSAAFGISTAGVTVTDGVLDVGGPMELLGDLTLDGATVELDLDLVIDGAVRASGSTSAFVAPGSDVTATIGELVVTDTFVVGDGVFSAEVSDTTLDGGLVGGGMLWSFEQVRATAGDNAVGFGPVALGGVAVDAGARLVVSDVTNLGDADFSVAGTLDLTEPGTSLGTLRLTGADAVVRIDEGAPNVLGGIASIDGLELVDVALVVDADLTVVVLDLADGGLRSDGDLSVVSLASTGSGSAIEASSVRLVADPDGFLPTRLVLGTTTEPSTLTIVGDLSLAAATETSTLLDGPLAAPLLTVTGSLALDGTLGVVLAEPVAGGSDEALMTFGSSTGSTTTELTGAGASSAEVVQDATSIRVRSIVPATDTLLVLGVELGTRDDQPTSISFAWPRIDGATSYEIRRDGTPVLATTGRVATIDAPAGTTAIYSVVGVDDGKPLGSAGALPVHATPNACTTFWTGAIDSDWHERLNWAPVVAHGEVLPAARVPDATDLVCVLVDQALPIEVDSDASAGFLLSFDEVDGSVGFPASTPVVAVSGADLDVGSGMTIASASITDGRLVSTSGVSVAGRLDVDGATVEFDGNSSVGSVDATGRFSAFVAPGGPSRLEVADLAATDTSVVLDGDLVGVFDDVALSGGLVGGGNSVEIGSLTALSGESGVGFGPLTLREVTVATNASLAVEQVKNLDEVAFVVSGHLDLTAPGPDLGSLALTGARSTVAIDEGTDNDLTGIETIGGLALTDSRLVVGNRLAVSVLLLESAGMDVADGLDVTSLTSVGTSTIDAISVSVGPDGVSAPGVLLGGEITRSTLTITGDLSLSAESDSTILTEVLPPVPFLAVDGSVALDGSLNVVTSELPASGTEVALVRWTNATGTLIATIDGVDREDASIVQRAAGLFIAGGVVEECGDSPKFAGMDVGGCWVDQGDGTSTADRDDNVDGVSIGGVDIDLDDGETIRLDHDRITITTADSDGAPAAVDVSVPIGDAVGGVLDRIDLGSVTFEQLGVGDDVLVGLADFFGIPTDGLPDLTLGDGGWNLGVDLDVKGLLRFATSIDLSIGSFGIDVGDLRIGDLSAVLGELAGIADLEISWVDAQRWAIDTLGSIGPSVTGEIDFTELDGGGTLSVRNLQIDEWLTVPDFDLTGIFTDAAHTWIVEQPAPSALRRIGFTYTTNGALIEAAIRLGDEGEQTARDSVVSWGGWLDVDTFEIEWDRTERRWAIVGRLTEPNAEITGLYQADGDGGTARAELAISGAQLGPFATFDLDLDYDGDEDRYVGSAEITTAKGEPIAGEGEFRFDDGTLVGAELRFVSLQIGELLAIDDFRAIYDRRDGSIALSGDLVGPDDDTTAVSGSLAFSRGRLVAGQLRLESIQVGPISIDDLSLDFARAGEEGRLTTASMSGSVLGPVRDGTQSERPVSGSIEFADGELTALDLRIGTIDLGGIAHIEDTAFTYDQVDSNTAELSGSGRLVTSDGATDSPVSIVIVVRNGQIVDARIEADFLRFAQAIRIDDLVLVDSPVSPGTCASFDALPRARQWQVSGTTTSNGVTTSVDGCLVVDGRRLVAGELGLGSVRIAELVTIDELFVSFENSRDVAVDGPDGERLSISRSEFALSATATVAGDSPISVSGSAAFINGGLTALQVSIPDLELMNVVKLRAVEFAYAGGEPWDDTADSSFTLGGQVVGPNTTSTFSGDLVYRADGRVATLAIDVADVDLGIFRIDELSFLYDSSLGDEEFWELDGAVTIDGRPAGISGSARITNGQVQAAELSLDQLVVGDLVDIEDVQLAYARDARGDESWSGSGAVAVAGSRADVSIDLTFSATGELRAGVIDIDRLAWGKMIVLDDVRFAYLADRDDATRWNVTGSIVLDGETTSLSGFVNLEAGRITSGELVITNLRLGRLANIDELVLAANTTGPVTEWDAGITFASGATGSGSMRWIEGRLDTATLELADIPLGKLFTISDASINYAQGAWALSAMLDSDGESFAIAGAVVFEDGRLTAGAFSAAGVRFGGVTFDNFDLVIGDTVALGGAPVAIADVCGVADPGGPGDLYGISARVTNEGGGTASLGGRLRIDGGAVTEGVACAVNIDLGEILTIDELFVRSSSVVVGGKTNETWTGSVELRNPTSPSAPFAGSFEWVAVDGVTTNVEIAASNLRFSSLLHFENASFSYSRAAGLNRWAIAAELRRDGLNPAVSGSIELAGKQVTAARIDIANVRIGNVVTLDALSIDYVGRRAATTPPSATAPALLWDSIPGNGCSAVPSGSNVPTGTPTTAGAESYFRVDATVTTDAGPYRAAGSMGFVDGRMSAFDLSVSCLRLGDWLSLEDLRIGYTAQGSFLVAGRYVDGDDSSPDPAVRGRLDLADGRITGGQLNVQDVGLGALTLDELDISISAGTNGQSTWSLLVSVSDADGAVQTAGGSVTLQDGKIVAGSLSLPDLPLLDLLPVRNIQLAFGRLNGDLTLSGSARFVENNGSAGPTVGISLTFRGARLVGGSFAVTDIKLFNVIPLGSFSLSYDPAGPRWSGSFEAQVSGQSSSSIQAGIEVVNGRVVSGIIGFDGNGDGDVDPPAPNGDAPASGNGSLGGLPLRAFFVRYCAQNSAAAFCAGVDGPMWDGSLSVELPTDSAPSLDAEVRIIDGKFAGASMDLGFGNPGIPIFTGVFLNSIGAAIEISPRLRFCGSLGATAGSAALTVARIDGSFTFSEEFSGIDIPAPAGPGCGLSIPVAIPDGVDPDYYRFLVEATATLFPGNALGIDIQGSGYLDIQTRGYLGVGAAVDVGFWNDKLVVSGQVDGSVFDANNVPATNPDTGLPLTGAQAQLSGRVTATVLGRDVASAEFIVNTIGWGGCARLGGDRGLRLGVSGYWSGGTRIGCDLGRVEIVVPGTVNAPAAPAAFASRVTVSAGAIARAAETPRDVRVDVPAGEAALGLIMRSAVGTPDTEVTSPSGTTYRVVDDFGAAGPITASSGYDQVFIIEDPEPGVWTISERTGSPELVDVDVYLGLPEVDVSADVVASNGDIAFDYEYLDIPGQTVSFVERDADGAVVNLVGRFESAPSAGGVGSPEGAVTQLGSIRANGTVAGSLAYRSNASARGGAHELVAIVEQGGLPRGEVLLATYQVAPAERAGAPTSVVATPTDDGASVSWQPPSDNGGRRVFGYRVSTVKGFATTVDGDVRTAELAIPSMVPGEDLDIYVQAITSKGLGETATGTIRAIASTGPSYDGPPAGQAPVVTSAASVAVWEGEVSVLDVEASDDVDVEGGGLEYGIGGVDGELFTIDAATGVLSFKEAPQYDAPRDVDRDNVYEVTVAVSDSAGLTGSQLVTISVLPVSTSPVVDPVADSSIVEGESFVATVRGADPASRPVALSLEGAPSFCTLSDGGGGVGSIGCAPWFGDAGSYDITVVATAGGSRGESTFRLEVGAGAPVAALVVGATGPTRGDAPVIDALRGRGFEVVLVDDDAVDLAAAVLATGAHVVGVSSSVRPRKVGSKLADYERGVVTWEGYLFDDFGFSTSDDNGQTSKSATIAIVDPDHPIASGLSGTVRVSTTRTVQNYLRSDVGHVIALEKPGSSKVTIAAWDTGDPLATDTAVARRVALNPSYQTARLLTDDGATLVANAFSWALNGAAADPVDQDPVVDAGTALPVTLPTTSVVLEGSVDDDGLPVPPGSLSVMWSGPEGVSFDDPTSARTTVNLPGAGTYVLRLTADDGDGPAVFDEVTVSVLDPASSSSEVVFVAGSTAPPKADRPFVDRLERAGYEVTVVDDDSELAALDLRSVAAVVISSSVVPSRVAGVFADAAVPVITWEGYLFDELGMSSVPGRESSATSRLMVVDDSSPLAGGAPLGVATVYGSAHRLATGRPGGDATVIAHVVGQPSQAVLFEYDPGDLLADGTVAPARRIALFADFAGAGDLTAVGSAMFDAAIARIPVP